MRWGSDKLKPTQPYFVLDAVDFKQSVYLDRGISHFYTFHTQAGQNLRQVPDGCIDLFFEYGEQGMQGFVRGTCLACSSWSAPNVREVFGVRFMPGVQPAMLRVTMREILDRVLPVDDLLNGETEWLGRLEGETEFDRRIAVVLDCCNKAEAQRPKPFGKKELIQSVKNMVYDSDGRIRVWEMQERTGYSERYIRRVFLEEMGFSPKTFCKIIQFQRAVELLNYGEPDSMTDMAVELGYYDQAQFIRDFTRYAGMTPRKYLKLVESGHYRERIQTTGG